MFRALPVARQATSKGNGRILRTSRRVSNGCNCYLSSDKKKRLLPRLIFYTTVATTTFYLGSAFQHVPFAPLVIQYGENHDWDVLTIADVIVNTYDGVSGAYSYMRRQLGYSVPSKTESADEVKTRVQKAVHDLGVKAGAIARHQAVQFSQGVEELSSPSTQPEPITTSHQPIPATHEASQPQPPLESNQAGSAAPVPKNVYDAPLPLGHEPPPGFTRPAPPKPPKPLAPGEPLPLVAPAVEELHSSEPVLTHLAGTIDSLASFLNANTPAADKARGILIFDRLHPRYTLKLLELELQAQDKLESQETDFRAFFEEEKAHFAQAYREKLEQELRTQSDIINERLEEEVIAQGIELQRRWIREIKVHVEEERGGRLAKLDELAANLKRLERVALDNSTYLDENLRIHALWSALRAVNNAVDASSRKPFRDELRVLRHAAAARDDEVVGSALDALEASVAPDVGVEPLADLASWFTTSVAPAVSRVALVPDDGAGVLAHVASHVLSAFAFRRQGLVPGNDVLSVLARAEYYLNEKDLDSTARELNQLRGAAKALLKDWLEAARQRLEVQQALEVVHAQATLASLLVAQGH
ncbi:mitochondrial inner membrane protein-domain-containing protein [Multifurca ochricompacta]|uniref:MICOS complex subunit MIC60 n=1 Tax=Multifurca ochricompacta TaxID=376703 RepID=A0AAD4QNK6_9AGAM|nr:mitochondrial inner membrane protein-domain-containing protein [Multifurca ochricompacta]